MGCNNIWIWIICWMLYWTKFIYFSAFWYNYNSSWVLPCCSFNSCTSELLAFVFLLCLLEYVFLHNIFLHIQMLFCLLLYLLFQLWRLFLFQILLLYIYVLLLDILLKSLNLYLALYLRLNPKKVSNGISIPSLSRRCPHFGHCLSGKSNPFLYP